MFFLLSGSIVKEDIDSAASPAVALQALESGLLVSSRHSLVEVNPVDYVHFGDARKSGGRFEVDWCSSKWVSARSCGCFKEGATRIQSEWQGNNVRVGRDDIAQRHDRSHCHTHTMRSSPWQGEVTSITHHILNMVLRQEKKR